MLTMVHSQPGHFIRDCPVKNAVGDTGGKKPREGYVCRACGSELHYIQDCPVANQTGGRQGGGKRGPPKEIARTSKSYCRAWGGSLNIRRYCLNCIQRTNAGSAYRTRTWRECGERVFHCSLSDSHNNLLQEAPHCVHWLRVLCDAPERANHPHTPRRKPPECTKSARRRTRPHRTHHALSDIPVHSIRARRAYRR